MIKVTFSSGTVVYLNARHIESIQKAVFPERTLIEMESKEFFEVLESVDQVLAQIKGTGPDKYLVDPNCQCGRCVPEVITAEEVNSLRECWISRYGASYPDKVGGR
jgi:uncharacterized protein YlzI (FlbEa/FlbD family)